jgi:iron-sulfur cluster assembly accessory protein
MCHVMQRPASHSRSHFRAVMHETELRHCHLSRWGIAPQATPVQRIALTSRDHDYIIGHMDVVTEPTIELTPSAVDAIRKTRVKSGLGEGHALRVAVVGGGCSGFSYQLDFDDKAQDDDLVITYDDVTVRVDPTSAEYLKGIRIDYVSSLHGGGFKFQNPNATNTCGCGSSFSA